MTKRSPMADSKYIPIVDSSEYGQIGSSLHQIVYILFGQFVWDGIDLRTWGRVSGRVETCGSNVLRPIGERYAGSAFEMVGSGVAEIGRNAIAKFLHADNVVNLESWRFPCVFDVSINCQNFPFLRQRWPSVFPFRYRLYGGTHPSALVDVHYLKLPACDPILIEGGYREGQGEQGKTPISERTAFYEFAKSHRGWLFLMSLGVGCFGGFWLFFGCYYFGFEAPHLGKFLLCALAGSLSLALVFAFAHMSY